MPTEWVYKPFSYNWRYGWKRNLKSLINYPRKIKTHIVGRVVNGYSWYDWVNFDTYLSEVIVAGLTDFKNNGIGYPGELTPEEWDRRLGIMIEGFTLINNKFDDLTNYGMYSEEQARTIRIAKFYLMKHFESLWD